MTPDLYARLDLLRDATPEQVKAAYRRKSKETHPDSGNGDAEAFRAVQAAYDVLGDPERRAKYDATGETGVKGDVASKAAEALSQLFVVVMTQELCVPARDNLVDIARRKLGQVKEESALKHQRARKEAAKLRDAASRFTAADGAENLPAAALESRAAELDKHAAALDAEFEVIEAALGLLERFSYRTDAEAGDGFRPKLFFTNANFPNY